MRTCIGGELVEENREEKRGAGKFDCDDGKVNPIEWDSIWDVRIGRNSIEWKRGAKWNFQFDTFPICQLFCGLFTLKLSLFSILSRRFERLFHSKIIVMTAQNRWKLHGVKQLEIGGETSFHHWVLPGIEAVVYYSLDSCKKLVYFSHA